MAFHEYVWPAAVFAMSFVLSVLIFRKPLLTIALYGVELNNRLPVKCQVNVTVAECSPHDCMYTLQLFVVGVDFDVR